ncbi:rod shape-determining protein RodA [Silvanigrella aquatica]|uniref:Rod shape-determining protein RodA n=1 Tax=Silvanigrella aquatica TaxID=1915309 RepID=A0A1L4D1S4_9BACT|nr:rod shape-determining protein RodA [Silvanigrella aquatica]APJ04147.1 rod shape-determining protein RodA [Silvanigrella aquatica]
MILFFFLRERFKGMPWGLILTCYSIIGIGLYNLYSATNATYNPTRFYDQIIFVLLGTAAAIFWGVFLDLKNLERLSILGYIVVCILLFGVDIFGRSAKGAERWLVLGPLRIQPSEFVKFVIILIVARSFNIMKGFPEFSLLSLWRQIFYVGLPFLLILAQPDLGTASLVLLISALQIATIKVRGKSLLTVFLITLSLSILAWNFILYDYQKQRVLTFINPMLDPRGSGYHSIQSMIAVGSGGLWGQGFGQGTQARLNFLPERHTDFAFSVWAEEHGFIGCLILIFLFVILIIQIFQIADRARDSFSALAAVGVGAFFLCHFVINISMVLGVFPVVGVPLSFISYGGTHMVTALSCIGIVVAVERKRYLSTTSF